MWCDRPHNHDDNIQPLKINNIEKFTLLMKNTVHETYCTVDEKDTITNPWERKQDRMKQYTELGWLPTSQNNNAFRKYES